MRSLLAISLPIAATVFLVSCQQKGQQGSTRESPSIDASATTPVAPAPERVIDRSALLIEVARAASATAAGGDARDEQARLDGARFELAIRFGCLGPSPDLERETFGWTYDATSETFRAQAKPTISLDEPVIKRLSADEFEAVEGFWIPRPWLLDAVCPAPDENSLEEPPAQVEADFPPEDRSRSAATARRSDREGETRVITPRVGIAQFFKETDGRTGRHGDRPYKLVKKVEEPPTRNPQGLLLVLSGRLRALPGMQVIGCLSTDPDKAPDCVISARIDRIRIERPDTNEILSEWTN